MHKLQHMNRKKKRLLAGEARKHRAAQTLTASSRKGCAEGHSPFGISLLQHVTKQAMVTTALFTIRTQQKTLALKQYF